MQNIARILDLAGPRTLRSFFVGIIALIVLGWPQPALPFAIQTVGVGSSTIVRWASNNVTYYINPACSADMASAACQAALSKGFDGWMAAPCGALKFSQSSFCNTSSGKCTIDKTACSQDSDCASASNLKVIPMGYNSNGRNELVFIESSSWSFGQYVLGVTSPIFYNNGAIFEADIAFNGYNYKWFADPSKIGSSAMDILSVAIHEEGHFFGVQHSLPGYYGNSDVPTMAPAVDPYGATATLNADDKKAICFLNPNGKYGCAGDADCPYVLQNNAQTGAEYYESKLTCSNGSCIFASGASTQPPGGTTALGGGCTDDVDCKPGMFCQPYGSSSVCSQKCTPQLKDCPSGFACYAYQNTPNQGACIAGQTQPAPTKNPGETCTASSQCLSLMCVSGVCRTKCTLSNPVECNSKTEKCANIPSAGVGACMPDTTPKMLPTGAPCTVAGQCVSGICLSDDGGTSGATCRQLCTGKFTCPSGFACVPQSNGKQACLPGSDKLPPGSACTGPEQCATGPCVAYGGSQFCSKSCDLQDTASCPCGMGCEASTAGNLCLPGTKQACVDIGSECATTGECTPGGLCIDSACRAGCDVVTAEGCGQKEGCARIEAGNRQGYCTTAGSVPLSGACVGDGDCSSLFCDKDISQNNEFHCIKPCDPAAPVCGPGFACNSLYVGLGACFLGDAPAGTDTSSASDAGSISTGGTPGGTPGGTSTGYAAGTAKSSGCTATPTANMGGWWLLALVGGVWLVVRRLRLP